MRKIIAILAIATFAACSNGTTTPTVTDSTTTTVDTTVKPTNDTTQSDIKVEATTK
jgi:ABC-type glycerol-3-phosphate transport system substrate-binding protein